jgi:hypothetical protein
MIMQLSSASSVSGSLGEDKKRAEELKKEQKLYNMPGKIISSMDISSDVELTRRHKILFFSHRRRVDFRDLLKTWLLYLR